MRYLGLLLFLFVVNTSSGQQVFTSPFTQHLPSGQVEEIQRTIMMNDEKIVITTITEDGKDIQTLMVQEQEQNFDNHGSNVVYSCTSKDGKYPTLFILYNDTDAPHITVLQPSIEDPQKQQEIRLLLN